MTATVIAFSELLESRGVNAQAGPARAAARSAGSRPGVPMIDVDTLSLPSALAPIGLPFAEAGRRVLGINQDRRTTRRTSKSQRESTEISNSAENRDATRKRDRSGRRARSTR